MPKRKFYSTSFWQRLRLSVLERDQWRCVPEHEGCRFKEPGSLLAAGKYQAHVHHKIDRADGGADRVENLVSVCRAYNLGETRRRQAARARRERERALGGVEGSPHTLGVEDAPRWGGRSRPSLSGTIEGMVRDPELAATLVSLEAVNRQVVEVLILAAGYLERLDDDFARHLVDKINEAFRAMEVENIAAASVLADRENRR